MISESHLECVVKDFLGLPFENQSHSVAPNVQYVDDYLKYSRNRNALNSLNVFGTNFERFFHINGVVRAREALEQHGEGSFGVVLQPPRVEQFADLDGKAPYVTSELLQGFRFVHELNPNDALPPALFASNHYFLHLGKVCAADSSEFPRDNLFESQKSNVSRTILIHSGDVIKTELVSIDYFERSQVAQEARFLRSHEGLFRSLKRAFPRVKQVQHGRAVIEMTRDQVIGRPIDARDVSCPQILNSFIEECRWLSENRLFHNDLRPWNLLVADEKVRLIDFADASSRDSDTVGLSQVSAFIGTILVLTGKLTLTANSFETKVREVISQASPITLTADPLDLETMWLQFPNLDARTLMSCQSTSETVQSISDLFFRKAKCL